MDWLRGGGVSILASSVNRFNTIGYFPQLISIGSKKKILRSAAQKILLTENLNLK